MSRDHYKLYMLRCADGTLYTGIARDLGKRLEEHRCGKRGAKYLRGRVPFDLVFQHGRSPGRHETVADVASFRWAGF